MRNKIYCVFAFAAFMLFSICDAFAFDLVVTVKTSAAAPVAGAQVVVLYIAKNDEGFYEPDELKAKSQITNLQGVTVFSGLGSTAPESLYQIIATRDDYAPTVIAQMDTPTPRTIEANTTFDTTVNIILDYSARLAAETCLVTASVKIDPANAPTAVFGGVFNDLMDRDIARGMVVITNTVTGIATMNIPNVPNDINGDEFVGAFDKKSNLHIEKTVAVDGQTGTVGPVLLDFTSSDAEVPDAIVEIDDTTQQITSDGELIRGVVYDDSDNPVPNADVRVRLDWQTEQQWWDWRDYNARSDLNGVFKIWDNIYFSTPTNVNVYYDAGRPGYVGVSTQTQVLSTQFDTGIRQDFKDTIALSAANGKITGKVEMDGVAVGEGHVHVHGDDSAWSVDGSTTNIARNHGNNWGDTRVRGDGTFEITGLAPGNYKVEVWSEFAQNGINYNNGENGNRDTEYMQISTMTMEWGDVHKVNFDDRRVTVWLSSYTVFTASAGVKSEGVIVDIPPMDIPGNSTATISGNIVLVNGLYIDNSSPVTIIAHEAWDSFDRLKSSTDSVTVSTGPPSISYVTLNNNRIPHRPW